jgi:calcium binding protein 39
MSFLFRNKNSPSELVKSTKKWLTVLDKDKRATEKISSKLSAMKSIFYGTISGDSCIGSGGELKITQLCEELLSSKILLDLLQRLVLKELEFESRKDVADIYNYILRHQQASDQQMTRYVQEHKEIIFLLVKGYNDSTIALHCGSILREMVRHESLNKLLLTTEVLDRFFHYMQSSSFDICSDAFSTFNLMLTAHRSQCAKFLGENFEKFFSHYNSLLESQNYVTKRQSLKFLRELLLYHRNREILTRYINNPDNLKIILNFLSTSTIDATQLAGFHIFELFVLNKEKSTLIIELLSRNKKKLVNSIKMFSHRATGTAELIAVLEDTHKTIIV